MLKNKLALITGSSSGLGLSIAKKFALNGANLILADLTPNVNKVAAEIEKSFENEKIVVSSHVCDVSDSKQVQNLFDEIKAKHPNHKVPSIVVNSAGITRDGFLLKMKEKDFDQVISVNLKGTYLISQATARGLVENVSHKEQLATLKSYGSIINIASVVGKYGNVGQANYSASKAGVEGFTRTAAKELGRYKIRCNSILPGYIVTPMTDKVPEKYLDLMLKMIPLGRLGDPEDVANLALFLASDQSSYVTGASIECSGGIAF
jgi:17beta-estradiol 17-dehydrogenase/3alpha(17beta)-hydroxysteroid dehydrogenase (NAD+)